MPVSEPTVALYEVLPALVLEFSDVMSPVERMVTVDRVAADAVSTTTAPRPPVVNAAAAATATARRKRFAFIYFSLLDTGSVTVCKQMHSATSPWGRTTLKRNAREMNKKSGF
jgi:hypothetical protein